MIIKDAVIPQPYATATWTSKMRVDDEWLPIEVRKFTFFFEINYLKIN